MVYCTDQHSQMIVCCGQGAGEDTCAIQRIPDEKKTPAWVDIWGTGVNHDWPWWRKMMPYLLEHLQL